VTLEHHAIAVDAGQIIDLLPQAEARLRYQARAQVSLPQHVAAAGFVNLHTMRHDAAARLC